eukprot:CAMPEP_0182466270 /NCGR_PEP_ID=MMETSP1319-20130603/11671_1 /TAXON_ID=172717 /ORGANISM="Bolidomonas pacifica, Strain RCC208" /LENGTH=284 /DNA_ID=CAMNT_0024666229 /DNA_START=203 /DNA_END=1054 /DNA_ORIENTATION=-
MPLNPSNSDYTSVMRKMSTQDMDQFSDASPEADDVNTSSPLVGRKESNAVSGETFEHHQEDPANFSSILKDLRASLPKDSQATDDVLTRFLRARDYKVKEAVKMYWRWKTFRDQWGIDDIRYEDVERLASTKLGYFHGHDLVGRPTCVLLPRNYHPSTTEVGEVVKFTLWLMNNGIAQADEMKASGKFPENYDGQVSILYDRRGMTRKNFDHRLFSLMRTITDIVQICYAERMGKIYVLGTNWFYHMMFRIISPLLSKKTREKVCVLKEPSDLLKYFDETQLER